MRRHRDQTWHLLRGGRPGAASPPWWGNRFSRRVWGWHPVLADSLQHWGCGSCTVSASQVLVISKDRRDTPDQARSPLCGGRTLPAQGPKSAGTQGVKMWRRGLGTGAGRALQRPWSRPPCPGGAVRLRVSGALRGAFCHPQEPLSSAQGRVGQRGCPFSSAWAAGPRLSRGSHCRAEHFCSRHLLSLKTVLRA